MVDPIAGALDGAAVMESDGLVRPKATEPECRIASRRHCAAGGVPDAEDFRSGSCGAPAHQAARNQK
jgi:hypothetical protein